MKNIESEVLIAFDKAMLKTSLKTEQFIPLLLVMWGNALKELEKRRLVRLICGSYSDVCDALICRLYMEKHD